MASHRYILNVEDKVVDLHELLADLRTQATAESLRNGGPLQAENRDLWGTLEINLSILAASATNAATVLKRLLNPTQGDSQ